MKRYLPLAFLSCALFVFAARTWAGENDGQDDLDKATEKKLSSETVDDLSEVLKLCESAMKKGLSPANTQFANDLYTSTLLQRGTVLTQAVFDTRNGPNPRAKQIRDMALLDLEKVVTRDQKSGTANLMIAKLEALPGGNHEKAVRAADQAVSLINKADEPALATAALVTRATILDDPKKQEADLVEALKLKPDDVEALRTRALFYISQKKYDPALLDLDALIKAEPSNPRLFEVRGMVLFQLKQPEKAIESYDKAIRMQPGQIGPFIARARARAQAKDTKGALDDLKTALNMEPDNITVLLARARVYQMTGDLKNAKADVEAALKNRPDPEDQLAARAMLAALAAGAGDMDEAISECEQLLKLAPKNANLLTQIGLLYEFNKQSNKAIEKFSEAIGNVDKKDFKLYRHRGDAYLNVGKHAEAIKDYEEAFKLKPDDSGLLNNFAWVLATSPDDKLRNGKRSIEMGLKACQLTGFEQAHILSTLAAGYAETGDFENALKYSTQAVDRGASDGELTAETREQLQREVDNYKHKRPTRELLTEDDASKDKSKDKQKNKPAEEEKKSSDSSKAEPEKPESTKSDPAKPDSDKDNSAKDEPKKDESKKSDEQKDK
jgi:tetratricopeptide (TPR) repeat protein